MWKTHDDRYVARKAWCMAFGRIMIRASLSVYIIYNDGDATCVRRKNPYNTTSGHTMIRLLIASSTANNPFLLERVDINSTTMTHYTMTHLNVKHGAFHPRLPITTHLTHCTRKTGHVSVTPCTLRKTKQKNDASRAPRLNMVTSPKKIRKHLLL